jgi:hypothetical protein
VNEMTIKNKTIHTVRDVIQEKRAHLFTYGRKPNWEKVKEFWTGYFGSDLNDLPEDVYQRMKEIGSTVLHLVNLKCELCDEYFDLDESFIELVIDHGDYDDVTVTFHPDCMREHINEIGE